MKKIKLIFFSGVIAAAILVQSNTLFAGMLPIIPTGIENILKKAVASHVYATVLNPTSLRKNPSANSKNTEKLEKFTRIEILEDKKYQWYYVYHPKTGSYGWLPSEEIYIDEDEPTVRDNMTIYELESFVNIMGFISESDFLVWTDISRQLTHIFTKSNDIWQFDRTYICATGKNISPTKRGLFKTTGEKGEWFYSEPLQSGAMYWVRFSGSYLFHSLAMDSYGNITDDVLGERRSSGCVRFSIEAAKWFYENIPSGTAVFIN